MNTVTCGTPPSSPLPAPATGHPVLLAGGARRFDNLNEPRPTLRQAQAIEAPGVTHIRKVRTEDR